MPGPLQPNASFQLLAVHWGEPLLVGNRDDALLNQLEVALNLFLISAKAELEGIFQHDWQEPGRWLTTENKPFEAGCKQVGDAANVVDMNMRRDHSQHALQRKLDSEPFGTGTLTWRGFFPLEQTAIYEQGMLIVHLQLIARARNVGYSTMVNDGGVPHWSIP